MTWVLYIAAAGAEIAGCFAFWSWFRLGASPFWLAPGLASLAAFAMVLAQTPADAAGRAYAAYGGVYVVTSLVWLWLAEARRPDQWDLLGAGFCLVGTAIIVLPHRG